MVPGEGALLLRNLPPHSFSGKIVGISNQSSGQAPIQSYLSIFSLFFSSCTKQIGIFLLANIRFLRPLFRSGGKREADVFFFFALLQIKGKEGAGWKCVSCSNDST